MSRATDIMDILSANPTKVYSTRDLARIIGNHQTASSIANGCFELHRKGWIEKVAHSWSESGTIGYRVAKDIPAYKTVCHTKKGKKNIMAFSTSS